MMNKVELVNKLEAEAQREKVLCELDASRSKDHLKELRKEIRILNREFSDHFQKVLGNR